MQAGNRCLLTAQIALPGGSLDCAVAMTTLSVNMWPLIAAENHLRGSGWKAAVQGEDGDYHVEPCTTHGSLHLYMAYYTQDVVKSPAVEMAADSCSGLLVVVQSELLFIHLGQKAGASSR